MYACAIVFVCLRVVLFVCPRVNVDESMHIDFSRYYKGKKLNFFVVKNA